MAGDLRIAFVGCGAVTERFHLPPVLARQDCQVTALIDRNPARTELLGKLIPAALRAADVSNVLDSFDAAIVAVPHYLHAPVSIELLRAGKSVLVEKPMAISSNECAAMIEAARTGGVSVTVGQMRRFCPAVALTRNLLLAGALGSINRVDVREGAVFGWPVESDFQFRKDKAGGGVLVDTGAHTLDMLIGWFGKVSPLSYRDDARGGVEADCEMELELPGGLPCSVELSRTRNLRNTAIIEGTRGRLEVAFYENKVSIHFPGAAHDVPFDCLPQNRYLPARSMWRHMFDFQIDDWLKSIRCHRPATVSGEEAIKVVQLIEELYSLREPLVYSWETYKSVGAL